MGNRKTPEQLSKFLSYVLGRRPDEFGLIPDPDGYVAIKELLKALHEEEGWRHVRKGLIDELVMVMPSPLIEIDDTRVRAKDRDSLPVPEVCMDPPKLLFTCVTGKSYPFVVEKGIFPTSHEHVILSSENEMAERMGRRRDREPVLLTVNVQQAEEGGVVFYRAGEVLFYSSFIPAGSFTGPPLPKDKPEKKKQAAGKEGLKTPGSFTLDPGKHQPGPKEQADRQGKKGSWKRDKKRIRRQKLKG